MVDNKGNEYEHIVGDIDKSVIISDNFYGPYINEPNLNGPYINEPINETINKPINESINESINVEFRYIANKNKLEVGDYYYYKIIATKDIQLGQEIFLYYGPNYPRDYEINPN